MLALELPPELEARLDELATLTARSKADIVREALNEHLDDIEDLAIAEQRLLDNRAGLSDSVPLEDVMKRYGLAD